MHLMSPIWLLGLALWLGAVLWLLRGSRRGESVPFLALWQGPIAGTPHERRLSVPPMSIALALLACLLGILAAARPSVLRGFGAGGERITIVVDRGLTMSGRGQSGLRFRQMAAQAQAALRETFSNAPLKLIVVPG